MFDERFARQYRYGPPSAFQQTSTYTGIVHHLSGPDRNAPLKPFTADQGRLAMLKPFTFIAHIGLTPKYSRPCQTPWSVFLDGSVVPVTSDGAPHEVSPF